MSQIDSFFLTNTNPAAHRYSVKPGSFEAIRKRVILVSILPGALVVVGCLVYFFIFSKPGQDNTFLWTFMTLYAVLTPIGVVRKLKINRKAFESFVLTIEDDAIVRQMDNMPEIRLLKSNISSISKTKKGAILIRGAKRLEIIAVPGQIDELEKLETVLHEISPIQTGTPADLSRFNTLTYIGLAIFAIAVFFTFSTDNNIVFGIAGVTVLAGLIYSFIITTRSKHVTKSTRTAGYLVILPVVILIMTLYNRLLADERPPIPTLKVDIQNLRFSTGAFIYLLDNEQITEQDVKSAIHRHLSGFVLFTAEPDSSNTQEGYLLDFSNDLDPIDSGFFVYTAVDLTSAQKQKLVPSQRGIALTFFGSTVEVMEKQNKITRILGDIAENRNVIIHDPSTIGYFSPASWKAHRLDKISGEVYEDVTAQLAVHTFRQQGESCRATTLGMNKFGLPDISIQNFPCVDEVLFSKLLQAVAQTVVEHPFMRQDSTVWVTLTDIRNTAARERLIEGATVGHGDAKVRLRALKPVDIAHQATTRFEIVFIDPEFASANDEQYALISSLFSLQESKAL